MGNTGRHSLKSAQMLCDGSLSPIAVRNADWSSGHEAMAVHIATQVVVWTLAVMACTTIIMYNPLFSSLWPILTGQSCNCGTVQIEPAMPATSTRPPAVSAMILIMLRGDVCA